MTGTPQSDEIGRLFRRESGRATASLIKALGGNFDLAEEAVQDAFVVALERWPIDGFPRNPGAWITTTARNRAIDRLRRVKVLSEKTEILEGLERLAPRTADIADELGDDSIPDDRLELIFTCCHPAINAQARVALTLRTLGGLTTDEVARAFLVSEPTMAQRIVRAKKKIAAAGIRYEVPDRARMPERLPSVLASLYLIFNEGYLASGDEALVRRELTGEAIRLGGILAQLMPREPEVQGLYALMLLHDSRRDARLGEDGSLVLLGDQDRSLWDRDQIERGTAAVGSAYAVLAQAQGTLPAGPYLLQATIALAHARAETAEETDWAAIVTVYDRLAVVVPSAVIGLNRAVAVAMRDDDPEAGLELIDELEGLEEYQPMRSTRADLLRRAGRGEEAAAEYEAALELTTNPVEERFLRERLAGIRG